LWANGHPDAGLYTLGRLADEAELIAAQHNSEARTSAMLTQMAIAGLLSEEANGEFRRLIESLDEE
jgi:hypothetical protein